VVYDFFNDSEQTTNGIIPSCSESFAHVLRQDFSGYLEKALPGSKVTFECVQVKLKTKVLMLSIGPRAVLTVVATATPPAEAIVSDVQETPTTLDKNLSTKRTNTITTSPAHPVQKESDKDQQQLLRPPPILPSQDKSLMDRLMCSDHLVMAKDENIESSNAQWLMQCLDMCELFSPTTNVNHHHAVTECSNTIDQNPDEEKKPITEPVHLNKTSSMQRTKSNDRNNKSSNSVSHNSQHSVRVQEVPPKDTCHIRNSSSSSLSKNSVSCNTSTDDSVEYSKGKSSGRKEIIQITTTYSQPGTKKYTIQISSDSSNGSSKKKSSTCKRKSDAGSRRKQKC
jgi:hypothetical protein